MHPTPHNEQTTPKQADGRGVDIVRGCQQGDRRAQRQLYENCHQAIFRLAVRMVGPQEAADVTQQVFLQAFRKIDTFSGRSRVETWLYRLAVNESLQYLRRMRRWQQNRLEIDPADRRPKHEQKTENRELLDLALARLEPELRSLFLLRELDDLSYRELADTVGIAEGTVASRLNRARRLLQEHLADLGWEP